MKAVARRAAYGSLAAFLAAGVAGFGAVALGPSRNHLPAVAVSVACCLAGFLTAALAAAFGSTTRDVWLGVTGLIGNLLVAATWITVSLSILSTT